MKKQLTIILAAACLSSCKTRQVSVDKTSITDRSVKTEIIKDTGLHIDTGKTTTHTHTDKSIKDSIEVDIIPDTGIVQIINGNYIGKARNIAIKHSSASLQSADNVIQQSKGEVNQSTLMDSMVQKNNIQTQLKSKQITAKGIDILWYWLAGALALVTVGVARIKHWL